MTHWQIAKLVLTGAFLAGCAMAGYIAGGIVYLG